MVAAMSEMAVTYSVIEAAARVVLLERASVDALARSAGAALRRAAVALPRSRVAEEVERVDGAIRGSLGALAHELASLSACLARAVRAYAVADDGIARRAGTGSRWVT
jgi:hypothetical protein